MQNPKGMMGVAVGQGWGLRSISPNVLVLSWMLISASILSRTPVLVSLDRDPASWTRIEASGRRLSEPSVCCALIQRQRPDPEGRDFAVADASDAGDDVSPDSVYARGMASTPTSRYEDGRVVLRDLGGMGHTLTDPRYPVDLNRGPGAPADRLWRIALIDLLCRLTC